MGPPKRSSTATSDARLLAVLDRAFAHHAGGGKTIALPALQRALGLRSEYLAKRIFAQFDTNGDGVIDHDEFLNGVRTLVLGSDHEKLAFAFRVHDHDGDGALSQDELLRMLSIAMAESEVVERATQPPEHLTRILFQTADANRDGRITLDELEAVVRRRPELLEKMTRSEAIWISPNEELLLWLEERAKGSDTAEKPERGWAPRVFMAAWIAVNVGLLVLGWLGANGEDLRVRAGTALGKCVAFDGALILVPMMRRLLTRLRATWLGRIVPVDDAIDFHRWVGHALFWLGLGHAAAFVAAFARGHGADALRWIVFTARGRTGLPLIAVFAVMWVFALGFIRRSRRFELFYFTHLLYVVWLALALVHAPSFAFWAGVPLLGFVVEQLLRLVRRAPQAPVVSSRALRSGVTRLEIARPPGFQFSPGDYAFLRIPAVARHEWHPFTISSAPERPELVFHVRALGNWTSALRKRVEGHEDAADLFAYVDGPYGSPSAHIFASRVAVLIGAGIGVTPFASILEAIVARRNDPGASKVALEKAYFFWLNKDQYSFEWFTALLSDVEKNDKDGLLDIHLCMTAARSGVSAMGLEVAREIMHASGRSDLITGLRTHTHFGSPDWKAMLGEIVRRHQPQKVDVYFCGPPGLGSKVRSIAEGLGMRFREERF